MQSALPGLMKPLASSPPPHKLAAGVHACTQSTWEVEAGRDDEVILRYIVRHVKRQRGKKEGGKEGRGVGKGKRKEMKLCR